MIIYVDIDGTICTQEGKYEDAKPVQENINKINRLFDEGHKIVYWTSRGGTSGVDYTHLTERQLEEWGCEYNSLMKKPSFDLLIDDRSKRIEEL